MKVWIVVGRLLGIGTDCQRIPRLGGVFDHFAERLEE